MRISLPRPVGLNPTSITSLVVLSVLALAGCASEASPGADHGTEHPPNIVFIMADDLGYGDLGSYGQTKIETPHLDKMAREGVRFVQFYAGSTVCAPSRSVLMTGLHTGHTPIRGNREIMPIGQEPLPAEAITVAEVLQEAGYTTGAFGKWGLGGPGSEGVPTKQGFDTFFGYLGQRRAHFYYPEFLFHNGERVALEGNEVKDAPRHPGSGPPIEKAVYSHNRIFEEALSFIEQNREDPFFLYWAPTIPHASLAVPDSALTQNLNEEGGCVFPEKPYPTGQHYTAQPMPHAAYAAMISLLDRDVGRLLDKLKTLGLAENTVVFFTSDNGPHVEGGGDPSFFDSNGPLRGIKRDLYEGGIRVPMIAWWPGHVPAGATSYHVSYLGDFMATAAELAGTAPPDSLDSISMVPAVLGHEERQKEHTYLYWEYYGQGTKQAVRKGPWKAVRRPMLTGEIELYDLQRDLSERMNVADEHPEVVARMEHIMEEAHTPSPIWKAPAEE